MPRHARTIAAYSPNDNVRAQFYPHILALAGLTDPRTSYWEPAKWVAKLRELKADNHLLLLHNNIWRRVMPVPPGASSG